MQVNTPRVMSPKISKPPLGNESQAEIIVKLTTTCCIALPLANIGTRSTEDNRINTIR